MTRRMRWLLLPVAGSLASVAAFVVPAQAAGSGTTTVGVAADAWYSASSACTASPAGCLPAAPPASPYPAKTLQVGAAAGQEESRSYLTLDLTALPGGTAISGGLLRLPIGGNADGSVAPDMATLQACAVTGAVKDDVEGATSAPPAVNCSTKSPAKYVAAAGSAPEMYTIDLAPFASAWGSGATSQAIVLLPSAETAPPSTWHASFSAHDRDVAAPMKISATVSYGSAAGDFDAPSFDATAPVDSNANSGSASFAAPPLAPIATNQTPVVPQAVPQVAPQAAPVAPVQQFQPQASVTVGGFAYPGVFLLPILLAIACGWLAKAMTQDLSPAV